jgi:23S rRNA (pseudouridine1915-N3)-methyltransferase
MHIKIIAIGKMREAYLKDGVSVFLTRLAPRHRIAMTEIPEMRVPGRCSDRELEKIRQDEGSRLLDATGSGGVVVALDPGGEQMTSEDLASLMAQWELEGQGSISFLIGGSTGLPPLVRTRADLVLSLSPMTFPHQLVRLILIEQIYRADCINRGIPYHK